MLNYVLNFIKILIINFLFNFDCHFDCIPFWLSFWLYSILIVILIVFYFGCHCKILTWSLNLKFENYALTRCLRHEDCIAFYIKIVLHFTLNQTDESFLEFLVYILYSQFKLKPNQISIICGFVISLKVFVSLKLLLLVLFICFYDFNFIIGNLVLHQHHQHDNH